ncbi:MAG: porphobilinogen synthase [Anaerolineales bacterium]|nr:porphobilinogen synthase [Anaerolineales bacterium]
MALLELGLQNILQTSNTTLSRRLRRLRTTPALRAMVRETELNARDFIYPLFVRHGSGRNEIRSMPGIFQLSVEEAVYEAQSAFNLGIPALMLFGIPAAKDSIGLENFSNQGIVQQAIRAIKQAIPEMIVMTDVCMCEYTDHGHCGVINTGNHPNLPQEYVLNDETLDILGKVAISHAEAGADVVAPSGMIDGMVSGIRSALDSTGFEHLPILSYSVKYASAFYGPFRDAAESPPQFGDRKTHQMDPANVREALRETALDITEGADMLMVKPALPYLDVLYRVRQAHPELPLVAYNVSGEYSMIKAAAANGWIDERKATLEALIGIKRAGADMIITYHAMDAARWLSQ